MRQQWYAVHTEAGKEALADFWLGWHGFETYFPHENIERRNGVTARPLLSRYLFVATLAERFHDVNATPGVAALVRSPGGDPFPIAIAVLDQLRHNLKANRRRPFGVGNKAGGFDGEIGDMVRGKEGWPHWGLFAHVVRICGEVIAVKMMMLGSAREVLVEGRSLELVANLKA